MFNLVVRILLIATIVLGILFRFYHLDRKIYWHDEVYTIFRAGGFTREEIDRQLFTNRFISVLELRQFLDLKPKSTALDTVASLAREDPQHPPLYFLLTRYWMGWFGNSVFVLRLLPAVLSVISLPAIYYLSLSLAQGNHLVGLLSASLLALSPVDILFAQTARQYSALTLATIISAYFLTKGWQTGKWPHWLSFALAVALGFYIHPFFALSLIAFGLFILLVRTNRFIAFSLSSIAGLVIYIPWIAVMLSNLSRVFATTDWATIDVSPLYLVKLWILSFTCMFFDLDLGFDHPLTYILRLPFLIAILVAILLVVKKTPRPIHSFLICSAFVPFLLLATADLTLGGKRSAVTRYLIGCFPFVQILVAHLIAFWWQKRKTIGICSYTLLLCTSLASVMVSANAETWWNKDLSYNNARIIKTVNQAERPILISDLGNDFTNTGDLIGMSVGLKQDIALFLVAKDNPSLNPLLATPNNTATLFVFRPSEQLLSLLKQTSLSYELLY
ncbi:MAG: glycosyltransferase family 39 protein [Pseudanabaenaceae cyanobacterium SKYGB_i_bin29]|nr:glycosyltransferase family 39 protein [Pseudanabaenaceae cyanobacterium SKYG29]MDW8421972.1 glycosyltransferase family 39 protein [Pseudanabaenaceae cyanobacterium SKYGB_i_bin29]